MEKKNKMWVLFMKEFGNFLFLLSYLYFYIFYKYFWLKMNFFKKCVYKHS